MQKTQKIEKVTGSRDDKGEGGASIRSRIGWSQGQNFCTSVVPARLSSMSAVCQNAEGPGTPIYTVRFNEHFEVGYCAVRFTHFPQERKQGNIVEEKIADCLGSGHQIAFDDVETIYKLDQRNAFADAHDQEAREIVYSRTAAGARMLRDLVYRAWLESALAVPSGQPSSIDANNPLSNPEIGSAPAGQSPDIPSPSN